MSPKKLSKPKIKMILREIEANKHLPKHKHKSYKQIAKDIDVCLRTVKKYSTYKLKSNANAETIQKLRDIHHLSWENVGFEIDSDPRTVKIKYYEAKAEAQMLFKLRTRHIEKLKMFSEEIHSCLYDPGDSWNLLVIRGKSYVFDPITWFYLCVPNFNEKEEGDWGNQLAQLRQHIKANPFFEHHEKLKTEVEQLQLDYEREAKVLSLRNSKFKLVWDDIQHSRKIKPVPSRVRGYTNMDVNFYPSFSDVNDDLVLLAALKEYIPDINNRLDVINKQLKQLNDDFSPEQIDRLIELNYCDDLDCKQSEQ